MATTYYNDIQKLYVAYFNRPADPTGLAYYEAALEKAGTDAKAIAAAKATISASFAASAEYKANFPAGTANADIVNTVYMNLFGRAADDAGKKYYADLLTAGKLTIDAVVTEVANGAQGADATAFNNKVTASAAFTGALTAADSYNTQAAATAAKAFLSGVTDNASLANAIDPIQLQVSIAKVDAAALPFSLQTGLAALTAANTAHTNFLDAFDGKADGVVTKTDADVAAAVTAAAGTVGGKVDAALNAAATAANNGTATTSPEAGLYANASTSATVKAAILAEAQADLAAKLTADQNALSTANANIAKVAGLSDALSALTAANTALTNAQAADKAAGIDLAAKLAAYNAQNTTQVTIATDGTVTGLITTDTKGNLVLATGVTETTNPGVTALLASDVTKVADVAAIGSATTAVNGAQATVSFLDLTTAAKTDLTAIANAMTVVKLAAGTMPTAAQITTELSSLQAIYTSDKAISDANPSDSAAATTTANAKTAYDNFNGLVTTFHTDDNADPLVKAQADANTAITADNTLITNLNKALATLATANTQAAELAAINGQIKAAGAAFTANNLQQPVMLDAAHASQVATAGADIYVASGVSATITNFGLLGSDALYLGSKYTLGADITKGDDTLLEAFVSKNAAGNVVLTLEKQAFATHEVGGTDPTTNSDLITITLTGVTDVTKVHLAGGIITVS